ncbi:methyltransferase domain-containing protein [Patescibacteria group bacterium]|nr:methyltransferase domain-containing protein [Patescibacteria group bacterium]
MDKTLKNIYEKHHQLKKRAAFSVLEKQRGELIKNTIGTGKKILDLGCRDGTLTKYFVEGNQVLGIDIDENLLTQAKNNLGIETLLLDLNDDWSALNERKFELIVAGEILEHLFFPEEIFKKVVEHLSQQGVFLGTVPNAFSLKNRIRYLLAKKKNTPLEDPTHINHFNYWEFKNLLKKYFKEVNIIGLGRYKILAKLMPNFFAFDLFFMTKL